MRRDRVVRPRSRRRRRRDRREVRDDHRLDRRRVEVADGDHRHQVRAIPVRVELLQPRRADVLDDLRPSDRRAVGIAGALQQHRHLRVAHARLGAEAEPPFLEDDAALLLDLGRLERHVVRPVLHDQQRAIDRRRGCRSESGADRPSRRSSVCALTCAPNRIPSAWMNAGDVLPREVQRAVERHVLDEMRQPALVIVLEHRAGVDDESKLGAAARLSVRPDEVLQPVRQPADAGPAGRRR